MVIVPHATVGAALGLASGSVPTALALGVASHYLLDQVPHRDYDLDAAYGKPLAAVELLTALGLVAGLTDRAPRALWGGLGGILPDVVAVLAPRSAPSRLHGRLHPDFSRVGRRAGTVPQIVTAAAGIGALAVLGARSRVQR